MQILTQLAIATENAKQVYLVRINLSISQIGKTNKQVLASRLEVSQA